MESKSKLIERSKISFKELAATLPIFDNDEELLAESDLTQMDLRCRPFWEDASDLEGRCYRDYMTKHPQFSLSLRRSVAERLIQAQRSLPASWEVVIKAGFRPSQVQIALLDALVEDTKRREPSLSDGEALAHAREYVADPRLGCPPHTTGGAVDIDIVHKATGKAIDMGCPPNTDDQRAALHSVVIHSEAYDRRLTLLDAMIAAGFAPNHNEWWHYSYGDTRWAAFYKKPFALYGVINN